MDIATSMISRVFMVLGLYALVYIAAIILGLLIFFKGRSYVRKKYGQK